ncbi:MAG: Amidohydrolase 3 [Gemmatimonadetes bacterium]|jgi:predicted amidohydrolase YtcJ|nr:Amidohydrolase 3 [Gemmatimonadota bacterium]
MLRLAFALSLAAVTQLAAQSARPADLIVANARIYTVDESRPVVAAMAVRDGRVLFTGSLREATALRGPATRVLDLGGRTVIPGMVDAHGHLLGLGTSLRNVDLVGARSYDETIARVVQRARGLPDGTWILGRGWDQNDWGDTRFPTHEALSRALPNHPVALERVDGHATLANAAAMRAAGVSSTTPDPSGGRIERGAGGQPTGVFIDNASSLIDRAVPPATRAQNRTAIAAAIAEAHRYGLVGLHDAGESRATIDLLEEMAKAGEIPFRLYVMIGDDSAAISHYFARGPQRGLYDNRLWISSVKLYADGALGSRGAALLEPYADDPNNRGLLVSAPAHIQAVAARALAAGFQVNAHAIGDRGNRVVLDAFDAALRARPTADHRFRVEHAQVLDHDDIPRFAQLGVIPSMQAVHQTSDMYWAGSRLGTGRLLGAYAWRSLLNTGIAIPNGSDFPVEAVNPLLSFHSSVSRQDADNWPVGGWLPEQRMTRSEALKSMTIWPAYAAFQESLMGSLAPGKLADFVVLDRDIMTVAEQDILGTSVLATYVGGRAVYERKP